MRAVTRTLLALAVAGRLSCTGAGRRSAIRRTSPVEGWFTGAGNLHGRGPCRTPALQAPPEKDSVGNGIAIGAAIGAGTGLALMGWAYAQCDGSCDAPGTAADVSRRRRLRRRRRRRRRLADRRLEKEHEPARRRRRHRPAEARGCAGAGDVVSRGPRSRGLVGSRGCGPLERSRVTRSRAAESRGLHPAARLIPRPGPASPRAREPRARELRDTHPPCSTTSGSA